MHCSGGEGVGPGLEEVVHSGEEGLGVAVGVIDDSGKIGRLGGCKGIFVSGEVEFVGFMVDSE